MAKKKISTQKVQRFDLKDLPCIKDKDIKIKKTYNYRENVILKVEKLAKENEVPVGDLISDILDKFIS